MQTFWLGIGCLVVPWAAAFLLALSCWEQVGGTRQAFSKRQAGSPEGCCHLSFCGDPHKSQVAFVFGEGGGSRSLQFRRSLAGDTAPSNHTLHGSGVQASGCTCSLSPWRCRLRWATSQSLGGFAPIVTVRNKWQAWIPSTPTPRLRACVLRRGPASDRTAGSGRQGGVGVKMQVPGLQCCMQAHHTPSMPRASLPTGVHNRISRGGVSTSMMRRSQLRSIPRRKALLSFS